MELLQGIGGFLQNQLLGMQWLSVLVAKALGVLGVDVESRLGGSIHFFFYDTIKIFLLLSVLIFLVSYIQSYFPPQRAKRLIGRFHGIWANALAALLGTVTPFCSCSSIPLFMGFTSAGLPMGVTFSFLISSPLVDLGSLLLLTSIFGFRIAVVYVVLGLVLAVIGGRLMEALHWEDQVADFIHQTALPEEEPEQISRRQRVGFAFSQVEATVKKVALYVFIGVGIGALIHNFIPQSLVERLLGNSNALAVPLATVVGVPMYADIFGTIPVAESLFQKGASLGTVLSFMMAVTALSLPSIIMLGQAVKKKLLGVFVGIVTVGIILIGYFFHFFGYLFY